MEFLESNNIKFYLDDKAPAIVTQEDVDAGLAANEELEHCRDCDFDHHESRLNLLAGHIKDRMSLSH